MSQSLLLSLTTCSLVSSDFDWGWVVGPSQRGHRRERKPGFFEVVMSLGGLEREIGLDVDNDSVDD